MIRDSGGHNSGFSTERPGYQRFLQLIRSGSVTAVSAFDQSRFNRNTENDLALLRECVARGVRLLIGDAPESLITSTGKLTYSMKAAVSEHYRNEQSDRMKAMFTRTFEQGGHRGSDPFGDRTARDPLGRVAHPRQLVACPEEVAVVHRVFEELRERPFSEISDRFNDENILRPSPGPWSADAVKVIWDRRLLDAGFVVLGRRRLDPRPGRHEPIISEDQLRDATAGVEGRKRGRGKPPKSRRTYLLRGLLFCSCGTRMRGDARLVGGRDHRYYACPVSDGRGRWLGPDGEEVRCDERRVRAEVAERLVLEAAANLGLPAEAITAAREELRQRLRVPAPGLSDRQRTSLKARLDKVQDMYEWGHLQEAEYRAKREDLERQLLLLLLPDHDKLVTFDRHREVLVSMADSIAIAKPARRQELLGMLVERIVASGRQVRDVIWTPAARPFFGADRATFENGVVVLARPEGLEPPTL